MSLYCGYVEYIPGKYDEDGNDLERCCVCDAVIPVPGADCYICDRPELDALNCSAEDKS